MGRLTIYFSLTSEAEKAAKAGKSLQDGWRDFTLRGITHLESYISIEKGKELFKEAFQAAKKAFPEEPEEGGLAISYMQGFPKS